LRDPDPDAERPARGLTGTGGGTPHQATMEVFSPLLGWAFRSRNFMKNCPSGDGALRGLTRLPANFRRLLPEIRWQSRQFPVSGTGSRIGFSPLSLAVSGWRSVP